MSYGEWKDTLGFFLFKEWGDGEGDLHREDGPAKIVCLLSDGSIHCEEFWINGEFLGNNKKGFWNLWEKLTEDQRQAQSLLKYLAVFS